MANRVVVGVAAAAGLLYYVNEQNKERKVQEEEKEDEQRRVDQREAFLKREFERSLRQGHTKTFHDGLQQNAIFHASVLRGLDDLRMGLLHKVRKSAESSCSTRSIHLPLLSPGVNTPSEIILGAALAMGNTDTLSQCLPFLQNSPGLATTKLSMRSVMLILQIFTEEADRSFHPAEALSDYAGSSEFKAMLHMTAYKSTRDEKPVVCSFQCDTAWSSSKLLAIQRKAESMGIFILPECFFAEESNIRQYSLKNVNKMKVKYRLREGRYMSCDQLQDLEKGQFVFVTNFLGSFSCPCHVGAQQGIFVNFSSPKIMDRSVKVTIPRVRVVQRFMSEILASKTCRAAADRLQQLIFTDSDGVSLEHIAVLSGYEGHLLQEMRHADSTMIERNMEKIAKIISTKLEATIPAPDLNLSDETCLQSTPALRLEISKFVSLYCDLLNLVSCVVPRCGGRPPSAWVPPTSVDDDTLDKTFVVPVRGVQRIIRFLELDERDRLRCSRMLAAPSKYLTAIFLGIMASILYWLCHACLSTAPGLSNLWKALLHPLALFLTIWSLSSAGDVLRGPLLVDHSEGTKLSMIWITTSVLTETLIRRIAEWRGLSNPFEQRLATLQQACYIQFQVWRRRLATRDYFATLKQKRIGYSYSEGLLEALRNQKSGSFPSWSCGGGGGDMNDESCFGILPGSQEDGEVFLHLEVVDEKQSQVRSSIESCFQDISVDLEACVREFPVGTRVSVMATFNVGTEESKHEDLVRELIPYTRVRLGSVVSSVAGIVTVQFDGDNVPRPIPSQWCSTTTTVIAEESMSIDNRNRIIRPIVEPLNRRDGEVINVKSKNKESSVDVNNLLQDTKCPTIEDALRNGGWEFTRTKKHIVYYKKRRNRVEK